MQGGIARSAPPQKLQELQSPRPTRKKPSEDLAADSLTDEVRETSKKTREQESKRGREEERR